MRRTHPKLFMTFIIMGIFLAVIAVAAIVTGCVIMAHDAVTSGEFEYLIVLGTTVNGTEPSSMLEDRINAAYEYLSTHESVICIVSGGMANENRISEASVCSTSSQHWASPRSGSGWKIRPPRPGRIWHIPWS